MKMQVKVITSHTGTGFEEAINAVVGAVEEAEGDVFPVQYQFNSGTREHTAVIQFQAPEQVRFEGVQEALAAKVQHGFNPKYFNADGTRKEGAIGAPVSVIPPGGEPTRSTADQLLPSADDKGVEATSGEGQAPKSEAPADNGGGPA